MTAFGHETRRNKNVSGITIRPYFGQSPALLGWEKKTLRWPGSFGLGFLSPQPPGIVGAGPNAELTLGPTRVGPFLILGLRSLRALFPYIAKSFPHPEERASRASRRMQAET